VHSAAADPDVTRPIAGFEITIMPPGAAGKLFGWIELTDSAGKDSGYVYFDDSDTSQPHLSSSKTYIVTHLPYNQFAFTIDVLQHVRQLQIRYSNTAGNNPSVFIESAGKPTLMLAAEEARHVQNIVH
jgi:hypothetical protein